MKILFLADYRSPIARNWIRYFVERGHGVHVVSTHPVEHVEQGVTGFTTVPIGFAHLRANASVREHFAAARGRDGAGSNALQGLLRRGTRGMGAMALAGYEWIAPFELRRYVSRVRKVVSECQPDLVHAMRIPFEGILAAAALEHHNVPLLISVWGNDFTLHAKRVPTVAAATRRVLARCNALHADCRRDVRLAASWGLEARKPTKVIPTSGGVRLDVFRPERGNGYARRGLGISADAKVVINPRGFRPGYVRNDVFFASIPSILERLPETVFLAVGMRGHPTAEQWVRKYGIEESVRLLPAVPHAEMAALFACADVTVSPSIHDGTPNTLLEAMACGAFPVAGNIESVREWIEHGKNGLLCDPNSIESLAGTTIDALTNVTLRASARAHNLAMIASEAEYGQGMRKAEEFYRSLIQR